MAKDYKLLYNALKKTLRSELKVMQKREQELRYTRIELVDKLEYQGNIEFLDWLLNQHLLELEGKEWFNGSFTEKEWKAWKKKVGR
jgi:hypothetical protein